MRRIILMPLLALVLLSPGSLLAEDGPEVGQKTHDLLELQRSGTAASPTPRPMPGDIAERVYERYAESFSLPVPENFSRDTFVESGSN